MATAPTMRANALAIPISHRDEDAKDATTAAHLFAGHWQQYGPDRWKSGQAGTSGKAIPDGVKERLESPDGRVQRGARFDLTVYRLLGILSKDDAWTTVSLRVLAKRLGYRSIPRHLRRSIIRLEADGSIQPHRWPWRSRKGTAYYLPAWASTLRELGSLRRPRPEVADLLKTSGHCQTELVVTVAAKQVVTLSQSPKTQIKTQRRSALYHGKSAADKESPGERTYAEADARVRRSLTPLAYEKLFAAQVRLSLEREKWAARHGMPL